MVSGCTTDPPGRSDFRWAAMLAGLLVLWHLPGLTLTPAVNHDEIMLNAAARSWTAHGVVALPPLADWGRTYADAYYWHPPGHLWLMAAAYTVLGFSIEVTRGVPLAAGAGAVFLLFLVLRRLELSRPMAAAMVAVFAAHPTVWWLCRSGRMDLAALLCGLAAMLVTLSGDPGKTSAGRVALAGALVGIGSLFHIMALVWAPALVAAESVRGGRLAWSSALLTGLTAALPLAAWVAATFARGDGPAWQEQFLGYQLGQRTATSPLWRRLPEEVMLLFVQLKTVPLLLPLLAVGLVHGWSRTQRARWWAAGGAIAAFLLIGLGAAKGSGAYPLYWFIWMLPVVGSGLALVRPRVRAWLVALALANAAGLQATHAAVALYQREARDPARVDAFFARHLKPGSVVAGPEDAWYAIERAGSTLRIWTTPDPARHDYCVTFANLPSVAPEGFVLRAELPDIMPKVLGRYWSHTACAYRIWEAKRP